MGHAEALILSTDWMSLLVQNDRHVKGLLQLNTSFTSSLLVNDDRDISVYSIPYTVQNSMQLIPILQYLLS